MRTGIKFISALLALTVATAGVGAAAEAAKAEAKKSYRVYIDGIQQHYNQQPILVGASLLVPMRGIFERLGAEVSWSQATRTVHAYKWVPGGSVSIRLAIGNQDATVNGARVEMPVQPRIVNGTTMVPLRFISEAMGAAAVYDSATGDVRIEPDQKPLKRGYRVDADEMIKRIYIEESERPEQVLLQRLEDTVRTLVRDQNGTNDDTYLARDLIAPLYGIDLKMDYDVWRDIERLRQVLDDVSAILDARFGAADSSNRSVEIARNQVQRMREKAAKDQDLESKLRMVSERFTVRYGSHDYGSMNQQEYDAVMRIVAEALEGYEQRPLVDGEYAPYYEEYLDGARGTGDRSVRTLRNIALVSAHSMLGELTAAGVPKEEIKKLIRIRSTASNLLAGIPSDNPYDGYSFGYNMDGRGNLTKTHEGREITFSAYDVLVRNLSASWSEMEVYSAVFDTMGYNTVTAGNDTYVKIKNQWWNIRFFSPIDIDQLDLRNSPGPTYGFY